MIVIIDDRDVEFVYYIDREGHYYHLDVMKAILAFEGAEKIKSKDPETGYYRTPTVTKNSFKGISKIQTYPSIDIEGKEI